MHMLVKFGICNSFIDMEIQALPTHLELPIWFSLSASTTIQHYSICLKGMIWSRPRSNPLNKQNILVGIFLDIFNLWEFNSKQFKCPITHRPSSKVSIIFQCIGFGRLSLGMKQNNSSYAENSEKTCAQLIG